MKYGFKRLSLVLCAVLMLMACIPSARASVTQVQANTMSRLTDLKNGNVLEVGDFLYYVDSYNKNLMRLNKKDVSDRQTMFSQLDTLAEASLQMWNDYIFFYYKNTSNKTTGTFANSGIYRFKNGSKEAQLFIKNVDQFRIDGDTMYYTDGAVLIEMSLKTHQSQVLYRVDGYGAAPYPPRIELIGFMHNAIYFQRNWPDTINRQVIYRCDEKVKKYAIISDAVYRGSQKKSNFLPYKDSIYYIDQGVLYETDAEFKKRVEVTRNICDFFFLNDTIYYMKVTVPGSGGTVTPVRLENNNPQTAAGQTGRQTSVYKKTMPNGKETPYWITSVGNESVYVIVPSGSYLFVYERMAQGYVLYKIYTP